MTGLGWSTPARLIFIREGIPRASSAIDDLKVIVRGAMGLPPGVTFGMLVYDGQTTTGIEPQEAAELFDKYRRDFLN